MILLIYGESHTGKTALANQLMKKMNISILSIDHLKMGLIRSGITKLTVYEDDKLTEYLWKIIKEIIKTAIENKQDLIIEGIYIPFNWKEDFEEVYLQEINDLCLVMSEKYIENNYNEITKYADVVEKRVSDDLNKEELITGNKHNLKMCQENNLNYYLIDECYDSDDIINYFFEKK